MTATVTNTSFSFLLSKTQDTKCLTILSIGNKYLGTVFLNLNVYSMVLRFQWSTFHLQMGCISLHSTYINTWFYDAGLIQCWFHIFSGKMPINFLNWVYYTIYHWKDRSWSWGSNTLAISWEVKTPWKKSVKARGEGDDRGWDGWTVSSKLPTWIWPNSGRQWKTGGPGLL